MKNPIVSYCSITIKGDFDTYRITQNVDSYSIFVIESERGYSNYDHPHKSLVAAIKHVNTMIKNEYIDRCLEEPVL